MNVWLSAFLILMVLSNLALLGSSRLGVCIRCVAFQGWLLAFLPFFVHTEGAVYRLLLIALGTLVLKGFVFPALLTRSMQEADVRREVEPFIGYSLSLLFGLVAWLGCHWIAARFPLPTEPGTVLLLSEALFTMYAGFFLIVSRKKALTQVIGYLVLENGIYIIGITLAQNEPLLVEMGILLDVFAAVFIMGITMFHINREFDHIDTDRLSTLKDWDS